MQFAVLARKRAIQHWLNDNHVGHEWRATPLHEQPTHGSCLSILVIEDIAGATLFKLRWGHESHATL